LANRTNDFETRGARIFAISVDSREESVTFASKLNIPFPLLEDVGLKTALAYGVAMAGEDIAVPSVFIVTRDSKVAFKHVGESISDRPTPDDLIGVIEKLK
jgi:peroxiredoxin